MPIQIKVEQTKCFSKSIRKLKSNQIVELESAVKKIMSNPLIGTLKLGDLSGVRVFKFKIFKQEYLLAYNYDIITCTVILLAIGPHENFYRDLKR